MKKSAVSFFVFLTIFLLATASFISIQPLQTEATTCPVGYTCTPVASATNSSCQWQTNLRFGEQDATTTGPVTCLQNFLSNLGYFTHVPTGYFGPVTLAAVKKFQSTHDLPSTGYVGPLTRTLAQNIGQLATAPGSLPTTANSTSQSSPLTVVPHYVPSTSGGGSNAMSCYSGQTLVNGVCTILTVNPTFALTSPPIIVIAGTNTGSSTSTASTTFNVNVTTDNTSAYFGSQSSNVPAFNFSISNNAGTKIYDSNPADNVTSIFGASDVSSTTTIPNSGVSTTSVPAGSFYLDTQTSATIGANITFPEKDKTGTVLSAGPYTVQLSTINWSPSNGASSVTSGSPSFTPSGQTDSSSVTVATDSATPQSSIFGVTSTTTGTCSLTPIFVFDATAANESLHLHSVALNITTSGTGSATTAYLYQGSGVGQGSVLVASSTITGGKAILSNIADNTVGAGLPVNATVPYTVRVDLTGVTPGNSVNVNSSLDTSSNTQIYNLNDAPVSLSGSATANQETCLNGALIVTPGSAPNTPTSEVGGTVPGTYTAATWPFTFTVSAGNSPIYISANPGTAVQINSDLVSAGSSSPGPLGIGAASSTQPVSITVASSITGDTNSGLGTGATGSFYVPSNSYRTFTVNVIDSNAGNASTDINAIVALTGVYYGTTTVSSGIKVGTTTAATGYSGTQSLVTSFSPVQSPPTTLVTH